MFKTLLIVSKFLRTKYFNPGLNHVSRYLILSKAMREENQDRNASHFVKWKIMLPWNN